MISAGRPGHAGVVGGLLAGLADDEVDLGAGLGDDLLDAAGWMRPSAISLVSAIRAISRRTGSKPVRTTVSGVSSMIRSTPVAFSSARMLRPSRPMIRPFISSRRQVDDR